MKDSERIKFVKSYSTATKDKLIFEKYRNYMISAKQGAMMIGNNNHITVTEEQFEANANELGYRRGGYKGVEDD